MLLDAVPSHRRGTSLLVGDVYQMKIILPSLHRMSYRPIWPDSRIVRVHGVLNSVSLVTIWLWWVWVIKLDRNDITHK